MQSPVSPVAATSPLPFFAFVSPSVRHPALALLFLYQKLMKRKVAVLKFKTVQMTLESPLLVRIFNCITWLTAGAMNRSEFFVVNSEVWETVYYYNYSR